MHWWRSVAILVALSWPAHAVAQIDQTLAAQYFKEAAALCEKDGGRLWGRSFCGPIVIADPRTGEIATNQAAPDAPRPAALGFANAAMRWGDTRWTTIVWPLIPADPHRRARLLVHELFHRIQPDLGLFVGDGDNAHLDTLIGRYWLQLEWRALSAGLAADGAPRQQAIREALAFRAARHAAFPAAAAAERTALINEGLPQYTGTLVAADGQAAAVSDARLQLAEAPSTPSFVRSFAYPSGAAYGLLLDALSPGWPRRIKGTDDLPMMTMAAAGVGPAEDLAAAEARYGGAALRSAEEAREADRRARVAELRRRFVEGPVVVVPAVSGAAYVTLGLTPIPGAGTVYQQYRVKAEWGSLQAASVLVSTDRTTVSLPGPFTTSGSVLTGDGWTLTLAPGWTVRPGPRAGDFVVVRAGQALAVDGRGGDSRSAARYTNTDPIQ